MEMVFTTWIKLTIICTSQRAPALRRMNSKGSTQSDSLIRTKLRLPFTRPGLVSRPRLQERIAQGLRGPLTLITAPAGFGKTTLVATVRRQLWIARGLAVSG